MSVYWRTAVLASCLPCLAACTLANEQLALPTPIGGSIAQTGSIPGRTGVPLGDPATPGAEQKHIYEGSAKFLGERGPQAAKAIGSVNGEGVTLDLVNASIPEAAKAVLGDVMGVSYIISDKVKGSVTLQTAKPVAKEGLLEIFESVLATNDAVIVVEGQVYKIVTRDEAVAAGKPVVQRGTQQGPRGPGISTEVVPLKYVSAEEIERILKSVAPQSGIARVDSARNLIMLSGTAIEVASMVETIGVFDVDWMRGMSFGIFPIETSDTEAIAQELDTIFANDRESPTKGIVRFVPNARLKAILVITSRPEYLKKAETWIKRIDLASEATEKRAFVYHVQYRPVQELAQLLQKLYGTRGRTEAAQQQGIGGIATGSLGSDTFTSTGTDGSMGTQRVVDGGPLPAPLPPQAFDGSRTGGPVTAPGQGPSLPTGPLSGEPAAGDVSGALLPALPPSGSLAKAPPDDRNSGISVVADEANNALIISATPSEIKRVRQMLSQIDTIPPQVLLEATIAEVTLSDDLKFGLRYFFEKGGSEFRQTDTLAGGGIIGAIAPAFPGFSYFLNTQNAKVALNALADITNVNVVSSPSLMVLNNKKAVLQIGDEVPIATKAVVTVDAPDAPIVNSIEMRNTGVLLTIIPRVSQDGRILLEIDQEVSDAVTTTSSTIDSPTIQQRHIKTTVAVNDGGSIVLAGMMQDRATRTRQQVPVAGDIPLLGNLFKNKDDEISRTELLIAITPHVVNDTSQIGMIAAEFRDRLNFQTRPQRATPPDRKELLDRLAR